MRRGEQTIRRTLTIVGEQLALPSMIRGRTPVLPNKAGTTAFDLPQPALGFDIRSVLGKTGPVPPELLEDPAPVDSTPWSIREADKEKDRGRMRMLWVTAAGVSWAVTAVAVLRLLEIL